ncbi:hypothetical protein [Actinomadura sp. GC306]|uniref:hypothetical protein n=1 Tax=Actinomadura sp. GC306 TaxID=2530367 RepID=UPI0014054E7B|nr:hypothetical protein [Actinomadura sp. GC306]
MGDESSEAPAVGDVKFADSGDVVVFDGDKWLPIRELPAEGPVVFRDEQAGP